MGHLIVFLVIGIILVTITIDFVAAELINNVHYMGRGVGKAKELAGKMIQVRDFICFLSLIYLDFIYFKNVIQQSILHIPRDFIYNVTPIL